MLVACDVLRVSVDTQFTAAVLLHRYYESFNKNLQDDSVAGWMGEPAEEESSQPERSYPPDPALRDVLAACLFLACKVEEEPRRLRDVVNCAHQLAWEDDSESRDDTTMNLIWNPQPPCLHDAAY